MLALDMTKVAFTDPFRLRGPFEVKYSDDEAPIWNPLAEGESLVQQAERALLTKQKARWAYQKEYRFIIHRGDDITLGDYAMPPAALACAPLAGD